VNKNYKIISSIFIFLILILTTTSSASFLNQPGYKTISKNKTDQPITIREGWPQIYKGDHDAFASDIVIDSQDNIIVTGYSGEGSSYNAYTIKYDNNGNEIWSASYNSGKHDVGYYISIDRNDNIYILGYSGNLPISVGDYFILKYSSEGIEQFVQTFNAGECDYPGGIIVDNNDNIIVTGGSGIWQMNMHYWIRKLDNNCNELWNHTFQESPLDLGLGVTIDSQNNIISTGLSATPFIEGVFLIKYSENGDIIWEKRRPGSEPWDINIDSQDNTVVTGTGYSGQSLTMFTTKCDKDGTLLWHNEYDSGSYDGGRCVAIDSNDNILIGGFSGFSYDEYFEHCAVMYDSDGNELCIKREGIEGFIYGAAFDSNDAVFITGSIQEGIYGYYTTKYTDMVPPTIKFDKPREQFLHIFSIPILPLPKRTIALGKLNIVLKSEDPADIQYGELYLDNHLIETFTSSPYEWTWDNSTLGTHSIKVIAYDNSGCAEKSEIEVLKIF
jgi:hypothetical protein